MLQNQLSASPEQLFNNFPHEWAPALKCEQVQAAIKQVSNFLNLQLSQGAVIFPHTPFKALELTSPQNTRVIILGQDPYHGPNQAQGLAFSVPSQQKCPPSLRNILNEIKREYPDQLHHGGNDLSGWAQQGVLLLNAVLTVESGKPASHANQGWETITSAILKYAVKTTTPKVVMLWGAHAQRKASEVLNSTGKIHVLRANHPSPLSANRPPIPFNGCGHFLKANQWLQSQGVEPIAWLAN